MAMPGLSRSGNWNENNLNPLSRINWRASLVPAAAAIPAPIVHVKVVAVKKLVVGFLVQQFSRQRSRSLTELTRQITPPTKIAAITGL